MEVNAIMYFDKKLDHVSQGSKYTSDNDLLDNERAFLIKQKYCLAYLLIRHNQHLFSTI